MEVFFFSNYVFNILKIYFKTCALNIIVKLNNHYIIFELFIFSYTHLTHYFMVISLFCITSFFLISFYIKMYIDLSGEELMETTVVESASVQW